ncbi:MAG: calcium/sodium antiporter [Desulfobacterales bacterium]|nr:calcium/sodium antiporter [Desulfobacterales bacterium]
MMPILLFIAGLSFLIAGAEVLIRGSSRMAADLGISPLVVGLTVVAFGTSSPELAVSIKAALSGQAGIAVGNVVGSNIFNVLLILGISALVVPLVVSQQLVRFDVPLMIGLSVMVLIFALDEKLSRAEGLILVSGLVVYLWFLIFQSRRESIEVKNEYAKEFGVKNHAGTDKVKNIISVLCGLSLLVVGSRWIVDSAVIFAQYLGVSELIIGLTIVAAGTSLPEVVTSVIAAFRGERDIAVGNVVGSNIFNIMGVLGFAAIISPYGIEVSKAVIRFDMPVMTAVAFACLPIFFTGGVINRAEGALFLGYYIAYTLYLILKATQHDALSNFSAAFIYFIIPLTVISIMVVLTREMRRGFKKQE